MNKIIANIILYAIAFIIVFFKTPPFLKNAQIVGVAFFEMLKGIKEKFKEKFIETAKEWDRIIKGEFWND